MSHARSYGPFINFTARLKIPSVHRRIQRGISRYSRKWLELGSRKCLAEYFMEQRWYVMDFRARPRFRHSIILRSNKHCRTTFRPYGNENGPPLPEWNLSQPPAGYSADACNPGRCCRATSCRAVRQRPIPCYRSLRERKIDQAICRNYWIFYEWMAWEANEPRNSTFINTIR